MANETDIAASAVPETPDMGKEWTWHMILNRAHVHYDYSRDRPPPSFTSDVIPLFESDSSSKYSSDRHSQITVGWTISAYRFEKDMLAEDGGASDSKGFLPLEFAKKLDQHVMEISLSNGNNMFDNLEHALRSPFGTSTLMHNRLLLVSFDCRNMKGYPKGMMDKALEVLSTKKYRGVTKAEGDEKDFNVILHNGIIEEESWIAAVSERPKNICLHIPLPPEVVSENMMDELTKAIHLAFPHAKVDTNRDLKNDPAQPEKRLLWACDLSNQLELRFNARGGKTESLAQTSHGDLGFGIDRFFRCGEPLKDLPENQRNVNGAYTHASQLLAFRPWSMFSPFEILKVTITENDKETIRWVLFSGNDAGGDGGEKSSSPFGSIRIQENLSDLTAQFGHTAMYQRDGMFTHTCYPDRLFIASDPIGHVHYDTIYLLNLLFGNSLSPRTDLLDGNKLILDFGVIPNMEVQTGRPDQYLTEDSLGRSSGRRKLTNEENAIVTKVCYYCWKFAKEMKLLNIKPSEGAFERTYPNLFNDTREGDVKVTYNMNQKYGGIWNAEQKWMWFD